MTLARQVDTSLPLGKFICLSVDELRRERDGELRGDDLHSAVERFDREWHAARGDESKATGVSLKERRVLSDSLARACGKDPRGMTATEARTCGVKANELLKACPEVTEGEIVRRVAKYRVLYPNAAVTPSALISHWSECGHTVLPKAPVHQGEDLSEPEAWQAWLTARQPDHDYALGGRFGNTTWDKMDLPTKRWIARSMRRTQP